MNDFRTGEGKYSIGQSINPRLGYGAMDERLDNGRWQEECDKGASSDEGGCKHAKK